MRDERGVVVADNCQRWLGEAAVEDERLLNHAVGPVLDIGCGPGRHVLALARRGVDCLGIDVTPSAVRLARSRGATVIEASIFGPVPRPGTWATGLLLDGNIGIGGDPAALLTRVASVLRPAARILVELGSPGTSGGTERARVEHDTFTGPWFGWTMVEAAGIEVITAGAGLKLERLWSAGDRWFARIDTPGPSGFSAMFTRHPAIGTKGKHV
ncbi:MAG: class I SAM-dependent methyltransferase [Actinomycetota bacterium]|nr:class I SAM-dependent methyltransferase [Actinomycetota bacterium]